MDPRDENDLEPAFLSEDGFMNHDGGASRSDDEDGDDSDDNIKRENDVDAAGESAGEGGGSESCALREQDRFLPIANITRIMKRAIPKTGKIAKDARECVQEAVSEFVSFITSEASDRCLQEKRKTINGEDILFAMSGLGFDDYVEPLKLYLQRYREVMKGEKPGHEACEDGLPDGLSGPGATVLASEGDYQVVYFQPFPPE